MPKLLYLFTALLLALNTVTANTGYVYINKETKLYYVRITKYTVSTMAYYSTFKRATYFLAVAMMIGNTFT